MGVIMSMFFLVFLLKDYWLFGAGVLLYLFYLMLSICIIEGFYTSGVLFMSFMGVCLFILSVLVCYYMLASSAYLFNGLFFPSSFGLLVFLMIFSMFGVFSMKSFIYFYVFFEGSLLPVFFLLMGWGYNPEKISASLYMLFYTIFGSMPLLLGLFYVWEWEGLAEFYVMGYFVYYSSILMLGLIFGFLIKLPIVFVHYWLPSAHVEAPVSGSIMLAGVLLSLGGYGIYLISLSVDCGGLYGGLVALGLVGLLIIGFSCMKQMDMKSLIAFSSIGHMSLVMVGCSLGGLLGMKGSLMMMLGHGISSSGLFYFSGMVYERSGSRLIWENKGGVLVFTGVVFYFFMFIFANISGPFSVNFFGEVILYMSYFFVDYLSLVMLLGGSLLCSLYSLALFSCLIHGGYLGSYYMFFSLKINEIYLLSGVVFPIFLGFLCLSFLYYAFIL